MAKSKSKSFFTIGNCKVEIEGKLEYEQGKDDLQISFPAAAKLKISVDKLKRYATRRSHKDALLNLQIKEGEGLPAECYFVCLNPKETNAQTKLLLEEVLKLYNKELPEMSYAANTGKESPFVERCVTGGKYCSLLLKSDAIVGTEEVIAVITYQILPPDTQYAEIPLAAVSKRYQRKIVQNLGAAVSSVGNICTHVVTGKVRRTLNFSTALCAGAWVVSPDWLKASFRENKFVDEMPFILKDKDFESKYGVKVEDVVLRARAKPYKLLDGFDVYITPNVQPPMEALSAIVNSAGGKVVVSLENVQEPSHTFAITCGEDMSEALAAAMTGMPSFTSDWFMCCIMKQKFDFNAPQFTESLE